MKYWIYGLLLIFVFNACETNEEVAFPVEPKKLVIESIFFTNDSFKVKVFLPKGLGETGNYEYRNNCKVEIQSPGKTFNLNYDPNRNFYYSASAVMKATLYKLRVEDPDYGVLTSDEIIPISPGDITVSNQISNVIRKDTTSKGVLINYDVKLDIPVTNGISSAFYNITLKEKIKHNGVITERPVEISSTGQSSSFVQVMYHKSGILIDGKSNSNGSILDLKLTCSTYEDSPIDSLISVAFDLRNVSENYYNYYNSVNQQILQAGNPLESPPPLFTNIKNGYGIFAGYTSNKQSISFPKH